jgi:hypothetical protein
VFARDAAGNTVAGTVTDANGVYRLSPLPPGSYQLRAAPLDNTGQSSSLVRGADISSTYNGADTTFLPSTNHSVTLTANTTNTLNFSVIAGSPAFYIGRIRKPATSSGSYSIGATPAAMQAGDSNRFIGVFSETLPTSGATFGITGDGITLGSPTYQPGNVFVGLNGISIPISVASNATPGARDFIITQAGNTAYASGFLEIKGALTDFNFDGFDDLFQRTNFALFTAPEAGPETDPDDDGMKNWAERIAGTNPTNAASVLKILGVGRTNSIATINWSSVSGKKYQPSYTTNLAGSWNNLGGHVTASGPTASVNDTAATNLSRSYRIEVLP